MKISTRQWRLLIAAGAAAVVILAVVYVIAPFVTAQLAVHEQLTERRALLARYQRAASETDAYRRQVDELRARLQRAEALVFHGEKPALAAAELQELLHRIVRDVRVTTLRENVPPAKTNGAFTELTVELWLSGELKAIRDFLSRLQTAPRLVTVPKLVLQSHSAPGAVMVTAEVQVRGYLVADNARE